MCPFSPYHFNSDGFLCISNDQRRENGKRVANCRISDKKGLQHTKKEVRKIEERLTLARARFTSYSGLKLTIEKNIGFGFTDGSPLGTIVTSA